MNQAVAPYREPEATPVGHSGTRVEIHERPAWAISGWAGILVIIVCIVATNLIGRSAGVAVLILLILVAVVVATSLVIVQPGHTKVVRSSGATPGPCAGPACGGSCRWLTDGP